MSNNTSQFVKRFGKREKGAPYVEMRHNPYKNEWWLYSSERDYPVFAEDKTAANYIFSYIHNDIKRKYGV